MGISIPALLMGVAGFIVLFLAGRKWRQTARSASALRSRGLPGPQALPEDSEAAFLLCTFSMLGKLVIADGEPCAEEIERVARYIQRDLRLDPTQRTVALRIFHEAFESPLDIQDYAIEFRTRFADRVQLADRIVRTLLDVSFADGVLDSEENRLIHSVALLLGLPEPRFQRLREEAAARAQQEHQRLH